MTGDETPYSPKRYERVRIGKAVDSDGKPVPARTVTIQVTSETGLFLCGIRVGPDGSEIAPAGVDELREVIALEAITKRTPLRLNLHYEVLEEIPS